MYEKLLALKEAIGLTPEVVTRIKMAYKCHLITEEQMHELLEE